MKEYFKRVLTDGRNIDKLAEFLYSVYGLLANQKYVYNVDLANKAVVIDTIAGHPLVITNAAVFFEAVVEYLHQKQAGVKVAAVENFVERIFANPTECEKERVAAKILWIDCFNALIECESTTLKTDGDGAEFMFEVKGNIDDAKMEHFNSQFKASACKERMEYLKSVGCDIQIIGATKEEARMSLIMCGGIEMVTILGGMLKKFYFDNLCDATSMEDCVEYLAAHDVANYGFDDLSTTYRIKIGQFLLSAFSGMRLDTPWDGREEVHGHYIVVKPDGGMEEFHSPFACEFRDYLVANMRMERASLPHMAIRKAGSRYLLPLPLQLRFNLNR